MRTKVYQAACIKLFYAKKKNIFKDREPDQSILNSNVPAAEKDYEKKMDLKSIGKK